MFTKEQRVNILQWSGGALLLTSLAAAIAHGLFVTALPYLLQVLIIAGLGYLGIKKSRDIWHTW